MAVALAGCAGPITHIPQASTQSYQEGVQRFHRFDGGKERQVAREDQAQLDAVNRVWARLAPAATRVCKRTFSHGCDQSMNGIRLTVYTDDPNVNAFAAADGELGILGGLVLSSGSDDELAMVMAHEVAHHFYGHNQKSAQNEGMGLLLGGAAALTVTGLTGQYDQSMYDNLMKGGAIAGARAYSPEMELEADHMAAFILAEAGYDIRKGGDFIVRSWKQVDQDQAGVDPISWTPNPLGRRYPLCRNRDRRIRRPSGARWSSWLAPDGLRKSWLVNGGGVVRMTLYKSHFISASYNIYRISLGLGLVPARKPHGQHFSYASRSSAPNIVQAR